MRPRSPSIVATGLLTAALIVLGLLFKLAAWAWGGIMAG